MQPNFLAIIAAGVAFFVFGAIWYNVLAKPWQKELGFSDEYLAKGSMPLIFGSSLILMIIMCFGMSFVMMAHSAEELTVTHGAFHGAMIGVFYCATSMGINYLYQRRSIKLYLIDAAYQIIGLGIAGAVYTLIA